MKKAPRHNARIATRLQGVKMPVLGEGFTALNPGRHLLDNARKPTAKRQGSERRAPQGSRE